jgi:hypothetical protein
MEERDGCNGQTTATEAPPLLDAAWRFRNNRHDPFDCGSAIQR